MSSSRALVQPGPDAPVRLQVSQSTPFGSFVSAFVAVAVGAAVVSPSHKKKPKPQSKKGMLFDEAHIQPNPDAYRDVASKLREAGVDPASIPLNALAVDLLCYRLEQRPLTGMSYYVRGGKVAVEKSGPMPNEPQVLNASLRLQLPEKILKLLDPEFLATAKDGTRVPYLAALDPVKATPLTPSQRVEAHKMIAAASTPSKRLR